MVSEACYSGGGEWALFLSGGSQLNRSFPGSGAPCPPEFSECFHGTAVAGIAAGYAAESFQGSPETPASSPSKVFSQCGEDCIDSTTSDWLAGLERVLELTARASISPPST